MNTFLQIIKTYKLEKYLKILIEENSGNQNPYHNFYHTMTIVKNIYFIARSEELNGFTIKNLVIAGLFHDFNHSGGKFKDDQDNVDLAVSSFLKYSEEPEHVNNFIVKLIKCTKYPYNDPNGENLMLEQKIIRDADLMQSIEKNYIQQCIFGLSAELGNGKVTVDTLKNQFNFTNNVVLFTNYAKKAYNEKITSNNEDIKFLINILK